LSDIVLTTAIEAGPLEKQVCLLAESIRTFGGPALSSAPFIAVIPRLGSPLLQSTRSHLKQFGVEVWDAARNDGTSWFAFLNKSWALKVVAAQHRGTIIWLDGDVLALGEPSELFIGSSNFQFAACCSDKNIGTATDDDEYAPYFKACSAALGIDYESLPYIVTKTEKVPIRFYWNSGVFSFDSSTGLAETYDEFTKALVRKRIGSRSCNLFMTDQVALGLAAHQLKLNYLELSLSHNFNIQPDDLDQINSADLDIRLLHYHGSLWPNSYVRFCQALEKRNLSASLMVKKNGPLCNDLPFTSRIARKILEVYRKAQYAKAAKQTSQF
jgi:lipopolysaccharide biosynthesis glycosyltransferase